MIKGIDVSHWQKNIDWKKIPNDILFCILKASGADNGYYKDINFETYKKNARAKGLGLGYYHFAKGLDPIKEADWFLTCVGDIKEGETLALDIEASATKIADPIGFCEKFVQRVYNKTGFWPFVYSYSSFIATIHSPKLLNCGLWIADPSAKPRIGNWKTWAIWQYTISASNAYTTAKVDQDYFNGTIEQFKKFGKPAQLPPATLPVNPTPTETQTIPPAPTETANYTATPVIAPDAKIIENIDFKTAIKNFIDWLISLIK